MFEKYLIDHPHFLFALLVFAAFILWRTMKALNASSPGETPPSPPEETPESNPDTQAPAGQFQVVSFDQYDHSSYVVDRYPSQADAVRMAKRLAIRPNAIPTDFSNYYHVYDDQGACLFSTVEHQALVDGLKPFKVWVDDNANLGPEERYFHGDFDTEEEAVDACREIVDQYIQRLVDHGTPQKDMLMVYRMYGEDPFVENSLVFSAWNYAESQIQALAPSTGDTPLEET